MNRPLTRIEVEVLEQALDEWLHLSQEIEPRTHQIELEEKVALSLFKEITGRDWLSRQEDDLRPEYDFSKARRKNPGRTNG